MAYSMNPYWSSKHLKLYRVNPNIFKWREFGESKVLVWYTKVKLHPNKSSFLLLYAITNEKTGKLMQVDRLLSTSKTTTAETHSNNSGRYPFHKFHIPWVFVLELLEHVSVGKVQEAPGILSICVNFTIFSFVMAYNNKKVGTLFGWHYFLCPKWVSFILGHIQTCVFLFTDDKWKKILQQILQYITNSIAFF